LVPQLINMGSKVDMAHNYPSELLIDSQITLRDSS